MIIPNGKQTCEFKWQVATPKALPDKYLFIIQWDDKRELRRHEVSRAVKLFCSGNTNPRDKRQTRKCHLYKYVTRCWATICSLLPTFTNSDMRCLKRIVCKCYQWPLRKYLELLLIFCFIASWIIHVASLEAHWNIEEYYAGSTHNFSVFRSD